MDDNLPDVMPDEDTPDKLPVPQWTRPDVTQYTPEVFELICKSIESGKSVKMSCAEYNVPFASFYNWSVLSPQHADRFSRAKAALAHHLIAQTIDLSDRLDSFELNVPKDPKLASAWVNAMKHSAEIKTNIAKRLLPDEYGDKTETLNRNLTIAYVVSFGSGDNAPDVPTVIDITPQSRPNHDKQGDTSDRKVSARAKARAKPNKGGKVGQTRKKGAE